MSIYVSNTTFENGEDELVSFGIFDSLEEAEQAIHKSLIEEGELIGDDYQSRINDGRLNFNKLDYVTNVDIWELGEDELSFVAMNDRYPTFEDYMF